MTDSAVTRAPVDIRAGIGRFLIPLGVLALSLLVLVTIGGEQTFPEAITSHFAFADWVNQAESWLQTNMRWLTRGISDVVGWALDTVEEFLWTVPWLVVVTALVLPAIAYGGLPLALLTLFFVMLWGAFDMWYEAMSTLAMMGISVALCVLFGTVVGVACAQSDRVEKFVNPILDTMQVMPAFVYLMPAIFFFGIGPTSATLAIMIYAMPPMIRLTNLGIRQVPGTMIEAAQSFGSTRWQLLTKVQVPQALPSIMLGINQTIMMALGLAVLAVFVGGGGLGEVVWKAIVKLKVGWSLEGGLCIVGMAIVFDRLSQAISAPPSTLKLRKDEMRFYLLPQAWEQYPPARAIETPIGIIWRAVGAACMACVDGIARLVSPFGKSAAFFIRSHPFLVIGILLIALMMVIEAYAPRGWRIGGYPGSLEFSIREPVDQAIAWLTVNPAFIAVTQTIRSVVYLYFLEPIDIFLTHLPWWYITALFTGAVWFAAGHRLALLTFASLMFCGASGLWNLTMYTLNGTLVSAIFCLLVGVPIGVAAAYSKALDAVVRPILDTMQTIPAFVYLVPALFFFGGNPTTAVIATVIYAIPPVIRTTTLGIRQVPVEMDEVATSFGARPLQSLTRIKLPLALPSIMLGVNQTVIMALAMQTVTPLVAGLGLGKEVYDAMNIANTGKGLTAGICIVLMAVVLDRLSLSLTRQQRTALGLT
ncbi:ABC transporter permease subunit [Rhodobacteraceae bacterium NNCM2]|nr:ABC transporter permease subunit [Coraliihabitans acroporae]